MSYKSSKGRGWGHWWKTGTNEWGAQTPTVSDDTRARGEINLTSKLTSNGRKVDSGWAATDCLKVRFSSTQTRRQNIQGCSIIHVWGSSPSPFTSHSTRLTRPSQYYQEDVCLHGSDLEQESSPAWVRWSPQFLTEGECRPPAGGTQSCVLMHGLVQWFICCCTNPRSPEGGFLMLVASTRHHTRQKTTLIHRAAWHTCIQSRCARHAHRTQTHAETERESVRSSQLPFFRTWSQMNLMCRVR